MPRCRICDHPYEPFKSFGEMPVANAFLDSDGRDGEYTYDLEVGFCEACGMVQLVDQPDPERMFHDDYAYFSSTSERMKRHFARFAREVRADLPEDPYVVEIGSNDGIMLHHFADAGIDHLGVEPARNVGEAAAERGVQTLIDFFSEDLARQIRDEEGPADAILAANVMCHIPDLHDTFGGIRHLLAEHGTFRFEDPYVGDILEKNSYDQIYDEHVFYFSVSSIGRLAEEHGLEVVDVQPQSVHGGSMRYTLAREGSRQPTDAVAHALEREREQGLHDPRAYEDFARRIDRSRDELMALLDRLRQDGARVVGYGATSKSTTVTNFCGITPDHVEFISDTTPTKQGKLSPGAHIPIKPPEAFREDYPDYALLFAWNHAEEILAKESEFAEQGGKWITYVPEVQVR